jgi:hypothetical protein
MIIALGIVLVVAGCVMLMLTNPPNHVGPPLLIAGLALIAVKVF